MILFRLRAKLQLIQTMLGLYQHVRFIRLYQLVDTAERGKMLHRLDPKTRMDLQDVLRTYNNKKPMEQEQMLRSYGQETPIDGAQIEGMVGKLIQQSTSYEISGNDETILE